MCTNFSEPPVNSASTIVATPLERASSTWVAGSAYRPCLVGSGGSTVKAVVNDSNGSSSMCATIRFSPAMHPAPPSNATVALPSASSSTEIPLPPSTLSGFGSIQSSLFLQRVNNWLAVSLILDPVPYTFGSHSTSTMSPTVAKTVNSPCRTNFFSELTTHVSVVPVVGAVPCAEAVPTANSRLPTRTASPTPILRLFMTPSKEACEC